MRLIIEAHLVDDEGSTERIELATIDRASTTDPLGMSLAEGKALLAAAQQYLVKSQCQGIASAHAQCEHCDARLGLKGWPAVAVSTGAEVMIGATLTGAGGPVDMTIATGVSLGTWMFGNGDWSLTCPAGIVGCGALVMPPGLRLAVTMAASAAGWERLMTLGTVSVAGPSTMVRSTAVLFGTSVPAGGFWPTTRGWVKE